jgi:poly-gamma-glutamate capsule biosynthesis protein CapA/YwtB (metallophosphatase superfamily)
MEKQCILAAAGDIVIRKRLLDDHGQLPNGYKRSIDWLKQGDLVWGSCEVQFSKRGFRTDSPIAYLVDPEVGRDLGRAGFQVMTVATNHTWDFGPDAFLDTLSHLREGGVTPVGGGATPEEAWRTEIFEINGLRIGILAVSCLVPPNYGVLPDRPGIASITIEQSVPLNPIGMLTEPGAPLPVFSQAMEADVLKLEEAIQSLRADVDVPVVSIHWGYGRGFPLATYQRPLARRAVAAGAGLVLGNHAHSPAGMEVIDGVPVIYSLGNHIAQQDREGATPRQLEIFEDIDPWSCLAKIVLTESGVAEIRCVPTECDTDGLPVPMDEGQAGNRVLEDLQRLSKSLGCDIDISGGEAILRVPK